MLPRGSSRSVVCGAVAVLVQLVGSGVILRRIDRRFASAAWSVQSAGAGRLASRSMKV